MTNRSGDVRELTLAEMTRLRPIAEVDPGMLEAVKRLREQIGGAALEAMAAKTVAPEHSGKPPAAETGDAKAADVRRTKRSPKPGARARA